MTNAQNLRLQCFHMVQGLVDNAIRGGHRPSIEQMADRLVAFVQDEPVRLEALRLAFGKNAAGIKDISIRLAKAREYVIYAVKSPQPQEEKEPAPKPAPKRKRKTKDSRTPTEPAPEEP